MTLPTALPETRVGRARLGADGIQAVLQAVADAIVPLPGPVVGAEVILKGLQQRENLAPTNIGLGVSIPHFIDPLITSPVLVVMTLSSPITWGTGMDPVDIVFGLTGTPAEPWRHVRSLAHIARLAGLPEFRDRLRSARDDASLARIFLEESSRHG